MNFFFSILSIIYGILWYELYGLYLLTIDKFNNIIRARVSSTFKVSSEINRNINRMADSLHEAKKT